MNKILRYSFVALMAMFMGNAFAQEVVFDFTDEANPWGFPTEQFKETGTFTKDGKSIVITTTNYTRWFDDTKVLLFGKKDATLTLPAFDFDVERIDVVGASGASGKVTFNIFVGEEAVSTEVTGAKSTAIFNIAESKQAKGTIYTIKNTNDNNNQITKILIWKKGTSTEVKIPEVDNIEALTALGDGVEATFTLSKCKVSFVSSDGMNVYVRDNTSGMCFRNQDAFSGATNKWQLGGKITGKVSIYNGLTQFNITDATAMTHTDGEEYEPVEITIDDAKNHIANLVIIKNVTIVADGSKFYADSEKKLQIYDNFKLGYKLAEGNIFPEIIGVIIPYNKQLEIAPITAPVATGIETLKVEKAAGVVYNLAGQRVDANYKGVVIQNGKKFVVK